MLRAGAPLGDREPAPGGTGGARAERDGRRAHQGPQRAAAGEPQLRARVPAHVKAGREAGQAPEAAHSIAVRRTCVASATLCTRLPVIVTAGIVMTSALACCVVLLRPSSTIAIAMDSVAAISTEKVSSGAKRRSNMSVSSGLSVAL